jgi:sigma-B regulation protein RsbU (phosphoserine phosphatase)
MVIDDLSAELGEDDPAIDYLRGFGSMVAIPLYDRGEALNMVALLRKETFAFDRATLPQHVWLSNLFGRATHNLVLSDQVKRAYEQVDRELRTVADIQRSLLPTKLPAIPGVDMAAHYQTSMRAGGDYYDFFQLPDGRWGVLIADVSGHGTPAAVIMAVTHSIAHMVSEPPSPPSRLLNHVNTHLSARYTGGSGTFVTAFYGIFDPQTRRLEYASAGHPPPRVVQCGKLCFLDGERSLPLGIDAAEQYIDCERQLYAGDTVVLYTDGISEARNARGELFGEDRLDRAVCCAGSASQMLDAVLREVDRFRGSRALADDRTLLIARLTEDADEKGAGI